MSRIALSRAVLGQELYRTSMQYGEFVLRSGQVSDRYFDKYRFEAFPGLLWNVGNQMCQRIPRDTKTIAGLEMGGIALATAVSLESGIPMIQVRKKAKEYGTCKDIEGPVVHAGGKVVVIEDVITTGGAVVDAIAKLREQGCFVERVICAVHRGPEVVDISGVPVVPIFTMEELEEYSRQEAEVKRAVQHMSGKGEV